MMCLYCFDWQACQSNDCWVWHGCVLRCMCACMMEHVCSANCYHDDDDDTCDAGADDDDMP